MVLKQWKSNDYYRVTNALAENENATESIFLNVPKSKAKLVELNAQRTDRVKLNCIHIG